MSNTRKRASWSGQLAFVLAAAASAVGLGNLWRFPYLAAQYGGGTFIVIYLGLVITLGFTLMLSEIAIGRKTRQSQLTAYSKLHRAWGFIGILGTSMITLLPRSDNSCSQSSFSLSIQSGLVPITMPRISGCARACA